MSFLSLLIIVLTSCVSSTRADNSVGGNNGNDDKDNSSVIVYPQQGCVGKEKNQIIQSKDEGKIKYWGDKQGLIIQQDNISLCTADKILKNNPPTANVPSLHRRSALYMIDQILHQKEAAYYPPVQHFYHLRMQKVVNELRETNVRKGAMIWKLYNDGFIVRTATVTIGFDLIRGNSSGSIDFAISNKLAKQIVNQCDILFISHRHKDHADKWIAQSFIDQDKPVITPPDVWANDPIYSQVTHLPGIPDSLQQIEVQGGKQKLGVILYQGNQGPVDNNVVIVSTPEEISVAQTGDESWNKDDFNWTDEIKDHYKIDVLMTDSWHPHVKRVIKGFHPKVVLPGHENELGHSIDHREPYWLDFAVRLRGITPPYYVLTWGEHYHYIPQ